MVRCVKWFTTRHRAQAPSPPLRPRRWGMRSVALSTPASRLNSAWPALAHGSGAGAKVAFATLAAASGALDVTDFVVNPVPSGP